ncbi:MAG TPA: gliding motility-associated C-terminal domain-containing protein, partial [Bacteroidia bacterium]|nr:gliding motility-associated C-terminal domain-containing protein [Bacteroidia bacterium]
LAGFEAGKQPFLRFATVQDDKEVLLEWDTFANTKSYILSRSLNKTGWKDIAAISDETVQQFTDPAVNPKNVRYFYKLTAIDTCENKAESNLASTILLSGKTEKNDYAVIEWTPYEDWPLGVKEYSIETKDILNNWTIVSSSGSVNYKDETFSDGAGTEKCYRITAVSNNVYSSSSNTLCLPFQPVILIPNSFTPNNDLLNDTYSITTLGITELKINIYNIWGELLYTCNGLTCAWDGTYKSKPCPVGVYTYLITARTNENKFVNTSGQITLIGK